MNLLIMGAPGTGKGTMSGYIVDAYNVVHISTGDMLREAIANNTEIGKKANAYIGTGQLVPDEIIHDLIIERFKNDDIKKGFLFDGYPRTLNQAIELDRILKDLNLKIDKVINLVIDDEILKNRISGRRICNNCKAIYHITNKPSKVDGICDECGSALIQRKDDTLAALSKRLDSYYSITKPVIEYYEKKDLVSSVDASKKPDEVFLDIKHILGD